MNELSIPLHRLLSVTLWTLTGTLVLAGWTVYLLGLADLGVMLLTLACPTALGAAMATARAWAMCVLRTVRAQGGFERLVSDLHPVRD